MEHAPKPKREEWVLYVNEKKQSWKDICENGLMVKPEDII